MDNVLTIIAIGILMLIGMTVVIVISAWSEQDNRKAKHGRSICESFVCDMKGKEACENNCRKCELPDEKYICQFCRWEERCTQQETGGRENASGKRRTDPV